MTSLLLAYFEYEYVPVRTYHGSIFGFCSWGLVTLLFCVDVFSAGTTWS